MDAIDELISKTQNEVDRYNALITLFPGKIDEDMINRLTVLAKPFIDELDNYDPAAWPRYLEKNLSGVNEFYKAQADRLERLFHKTLNVPDMSDEKFAGAQSGVAIAYKLIGFEFLVSEIEVYFRKGLNKRKQMYFEFINNATPRTIDPDKYTQQITWKRNIPVDDKEKVAIAAQLMGLGVSDETILKYLPSSIIDDAKKELERMAAEPEDADTTDGSDIGNM
jgi:SPP1 family phage portal protein